MAYSILFVCLGNICRSPSAEGVVRKMAEEQGLNLTLDSAACGSWHTGKPPYAPMQHAASARGYDLSAQRARTVTSDDFHQFDLILGMDPDNMAHLRSLQPETGRAQLELFSHYAPDFATDTVPDPYYTRDFDGTLTMIEACAKGLLAQL